MCTYLFGILFVLVPWSIFTNSYFANSNRTGWSMSYLQVFLYLLNILTPFMGASVITYLKTQYGGKSILLKWINTDLLIFVCLARPLMFLLQRGNISKERMPKESVKDTVIVTSLSTSSPSNLIQNGTLFKIGKLNEHSQTDNNLNLIKILYERINILECKLEKMQQESIPEIQWKQHWQLKGASSCESSPTSTNVSCPSPSTFEPKQISKLKRQNWLLFLLKVGVLAWIKFVEKIVPFTSKITEIAANKVKNI